MKPHIVKRNGVWTCGIFAIASGGTPAQAFRNWDYGAVLSYAHAGVAAGLTWREYVKTAHL